MKDDYDEIENVDPGQWARKKMLHAFLIAAGLLGVVFIYSKYSASEDMGTNTNSSDVDICKCLTEPGNSQYIIQNKNACDEIISKAIGVVNWRKVNMKYDKATSKKFDQLAYKCTGQLPNVEIGGVYSGTDNVGMESTIVLRNNGTLIIQTSIGNGQPDYGWWKGSSDNLSLYHHDHLGNEQLISRAKVTNDGLQIIGGKFYPRQ